MITFVVLFESTVMTIVVAFLHAHISGWHAPTYKHAYMLAGTHTYLHTLIHKRRTYIQTYRHAHIHTYIHACIHTYRRTSMHAYINVYVYTHASGVAE